LASELWLDEHGEDRLRDWLFHGDCTREKRAFVRTVLEGVGTKTPYTALGQVVRDLSSGEVAITNPADPTMTLVIIPWTGEEDTFSIRYIGDLADLDDH
jgi:hypothetical protein